MRWRSAFHPRTDETRHPDSVQTGPAVSWTHRPRCFGSVAHRTIGARLTPYLKKLQHLGRRLGVDIRRYSATSSVAGRRARIMAHHEIGLVLDIGANVGQYALELRSTGFGGRIVSFEPLREPFATLVRESEGDLGWRCLQLALGESEGQATMHVAANRAASSSLLPMERWIARAVPEQAFIGTETVHVARLDDAAPPLIGERDRVMLKLDVQGYELGVLGGGASTLERADVVEIELTVVRLYEEQPLWRETLDYLLEADFEVVSLDPILHDADGRLLQMDGIFARSSRRSNLGT